MGTGALGIYLKKIFQGINKERAERKREMAILNQKIYGKQKKAQVKESTSQSSSRYFSSSEAQTDSLAEDINLSKEQDADNIVNFYQNQRLRTAKKHRVKIRQEGLSRMHGHSRLN